MTRILAPTPTRGPAPSHSPPDVRYAPGIELARALGWFSIGLGMAEMLAPRRMADLTGVRHPGLLQAFGAREIASGIAILGCSRPVGALWSRVAGDAMDVAILVTALAGSEGEERRRALIALAAVTGVTVLDVVCSLQLTTAASLEG